MCEIEINVYLLRFDIGLFMRGRREIVTAIPANAIVVVRYTAAGLRLKPVDVETKVGRVVTLHWFLHLGPRHLGLGTFQHLPFKSILFFYACHFIIT